VQTGGTKHDHPRPMCYIAPSERQLKTGNYKSGKRKHIPPVDILSSL